MTAYLRKPMASIRVLPGASLLAICLLSLPLLAQAQTCRVRDDVTAPGGPGSTWANAYRYLQDALADTNCSEIWVAKVGDGIYYPDDGTNQTDNDADAAFRLASGVAIYGGFAGSESNRETRDPVANPTILSGDIQQDDAQQLIVTDPVDNNYNSGNSNNVVIADGVDDTAVLDGFIITGGAGSSFTIDAFGGGMYNTAASPTLANLQFLGNAAFDAGGGMANINGSSPSLTDVAFTNNYTDGLGGGMYNSASSPTLERVVFTANTANDTFLPGRGGGLANENSSAAILQDVQFFQNQAYQGGGMDNENSDPTLTNVVFQGNEATGTSGGGINNNAGTPVLINVLFTGNSAAGDGAGMNNFGASPALTNTTFSANRADGLGGALAHFGSGDTLFLQNSILWNNDANSGTEIYNGGAIRLANSIVQGGIAGAGVGGNAIDDDGGNLNSDPLFQTDEDPANAPSTAGDYRLASGSPAIDAGNSGAQLNPANPASATIASIATDLDGNDRLQGCVDMGPYESATTSDLCLTIELPQDGTVVGNGLNCGSGGNTCQVSLAENTPVSLDAQPDNGFDLSQWTGDCSGSADPLNFTLDSDRVCGALFDMNFTRYTLSIDPVPSNGTVTGNGLNCGSGGSVCSVSLTENTGVSLSATPDSGFAFQQWSGDCSGTGSTYMTNITADTQCTASFTALPEYTLSIDPPSNGTVSGNGLNCGDGGSVCSVILTEGTSVELTASPATDYSFSSWSGACSGTANPLSFSLAGDTQCGANFQLDLVDYTLDIDPPSNGTVVGNGLNCGSGGNVCSVTLAEGTPVSLDAQPDNGFEPGFWSGDCSGNDDPLSFTLNANRQCGLSFRPLSPGIFADDFD